MHEESVMHGLKAKGLKKGSVSKSAAVTIGLAATAPAYSLTGALGYGASESGYQLPIVFILSVIPMFFVALSYKHLTTSAPDSGTVFTWGAKAIGPRFGWFGGWALLLASVLAGVAATQVIVNTTAIVFNLVETPLWFHFGVAILFILSTTYLTALGAEESSRTTMALTIAQYGGLIVLAAILLMRVTQGEAVSTAEPFSLEWLNPFAISSFSAFLNGFLVALFIFWGFDASLAMSEETDGSSEQAGRSGLIAITITVITYVVFSSTAQEDCKLRKTKHFILILYLKNVKAVPLDTSTPKTLSEWAVFVPSDDILQTYTLSQAKQRGFNKNTIAKPV